MLELLWRQSISKALFCCSVHGAFALFSSKCSLPFVRQGGTAGSSMNSCVSHIPPPLISSIQPQIGSSGVPVPPEPPHQETSLCRASRSPHPRVLLQKPPPAPWVPALPCSFSSPSSPAGESRTCAGRRLRLGCGRFAVRSPWVDPHAQPPISSL